MTRLGLTGWCRCLLPVTAAALVLVGQTPRGNQDTSIPGASKHTPIFVQADQLPARDLLEAPPANDSAETKSELAELHRIQDSRTPAQVAQAQVDDREEDIFVYREVVGEKLDPTRLPLTAALSGKVHSDEDVIVSPTKTYFGRPRPFMIDPSIHPVCKHDADFSYPSGHSTTGYLEAFLLAEMVPEKREPILKRADSYAYDRVVCGVHFPSDVHASRYVAAAMFGFLLNNPDFMQEFKAAKKETRSALGLPLN